MLSSYQPGPGYDEIVEPAGTPRTTARGLWRHLTELGLEALLERQRAADREIRNIGVTFQTSEGDGRLRPSLALRRHPPGRSPRSEWTPLRQGLIQRLRALNLFIDDVYHDQRAVQAGVVPD